MVGFARSATGPCCRQYRRDQRLGCIGQIFIVELVEIVFNSHPTTIICTRKRLFKPPLNDTGQLVIYSHCYSPVPFAGRYPFWIASFSVINSPCGGLP